VSDEPSTCEAEENAKREKNMKTIPVRSPQEKKKRRLLDAGLTSVRVRINESEWLVRSRGNRNISMKCWGH
jgi:hypothetical protein